MNVLYSDYQLSYGAKELSQSLKVYLPDCHVECWQYTDDDHLTEKLRGVDGLLTANLKVSEKVLDRAKSLKVISVDATGYGNIHLEAAKRNHICVCSIGEYCTQEVADHALLLTLMLEKHIRKHLDHVEKDRVYNYKLVQPPHRIQGRNFVIFGYGRIGQATARRAKAFGYKVYAVPHDLNTVGTIKDDVAMISKTEAFAIGDVVVNTMSETPETFDFFDLHAFEQMKRSPLFINVGRGSAVNEHDLVHAIQKGWISGAGLDVMKDTWPDLSRNPLANMEQVIITPHMAFYSEEAVACLKTMPLKNLANGLLGRQDLISHMAC